MSFLRSLNISASGMTAQRLRLDVIAQNVANAQTTRTEDGTPYRRQMTVFQEAKSYESFQNVLSGKRKERFEGVLVHSVVEDETPLTPIYDPTHPDADEMGYYYQPNVDLVVENTDAMAATRSWEANKAVFEAVKAMAVNALNIGKG